MHFEPFRVISFVKSSSSPFMEAAANVGNMDSLVGVMAEEE